MYVICLKFYIVYIYIFADDMILYITKPKDFTKKLL